MSTVESVGATVSTCFSTRRREALFPTICAKFIRYGFIFEIELFLRELVFQLSNLPKGTCILHGNGNLISIWSEIDIVAVNALS